MSKKPQGYWNGKPVEFAVLTVTITNRLGGGKNWAKSFIGEKRQAVKVMVPGHRPFYLDNEDGTGLAHIIDQKAKVTYRSLGEPKEGKIVPRSKWVAKVNAKKTKAINKVSNDYWKTK